MSKYLDLCGAWELYGTDTDDKSFVCAGTVPGCVHTDLLAAGIIPDPFWRNNSQKIQWIENQNFRYVKYFDVDAVSPNAYLEFDGLDTYATILLNGKTLAQVDNMFTPFSFCADGILHAGENVLEVCFRSPIKEVEGLPPREAAFTQERINTRRMQCTYSWDWVDRFVTMGIYRPVRLCFREPNEIDSVYLYTHDINPYSAQIKLEVTFRDFFLCGDTLRMEIKDPAGLTVFAKERVILTERMDEYIDLPSPSLWYPNGYGEQPLYTILLATQSCTKSMQFGIRKLTVLQEEDTEGSENRKIALKLQQEAHLQFHERNKQTSSFAVLVNGVKIMCKGANWVPCEPFPSNETPEKITRLLELGAHAGVNMLRVWGGGIFERDEFYNECDRLGILVTQDFLMACGTYPEDEQWFLDALRREARAATLRLRNHPCLAFWSGDNENAVLGSENRTDFPGYRSAALALEPTVTSLDPARRFFPSSPYGGDCYASATRGTTHNTSFLGALFQYIMGTDMKDYRDHLSRYLSRFCAEQPVFGMPFVSCLQKFLTDEDIFKDSEGMLEFHTKNNPFLPKSLFGIVQEMTEKIFGAYQNGADRIRKQQMLQCEWTRLSLELYRRNKGFSWGIIYWMFNDCWPAAGGWSFLDYYACPKPAYYTFRRCAKPVIASIEEKCGALSVHICNDSLQAVQGHGKLYLYNFAADTALISKEFDFSVVQNTSQKVLECDCAEFFCKMSNTTVLLCDVEADGQRDTAFFIPERFCDLALEYADVRMMEETADTVTVTSDTFLPFAIIDVPYLLSDNCFVLKKGEVRTLKKLRAL